jgi:NAD(P)-dependent dehydrogenase (short-subunit alcohol dehydrogenase family)
MPARSHILVTGSTRGIGAAIVAAFSPDQATVVAHGSTATGPNIVAADLEQPGAADALWDAALDRLDGRIDVLVNNAGVFEGVAVEAPLDEWHAAWARTMQINLQASADLCRRAVLHFRERDPDPQTSERGRIVNVASRAAYRGDSPAHWHYAAAKAGMVGMTKSIARGYARDGILAFTVTPGFTMTGMADDYLASRGGDRLLADIPLGRVAMPDEVANAVAYLALQAPPSMTGAVLDINGASYVR